MSSRRVDPVDAIWLNTDHAENLTVIEALFLLDGPLDVPAFERLVQARVVDRYPAFRQRVVASRLPWARPRWVDVPGFRATDQIRRKTLTATGSADGDDALLQEFIAPMLSTPLRRDRPLWEAQVVEGLSAGTAVFLRLHHTLADGVALTRVLLSLTDADDGVEETPSAPAAASRLTPRLVVRRVVQVPLTGLTLLFARNPSTSMTGTAGRDKMLAWGRPFPLPPIKEIARRQECTVNDVLMAALAGAIRTYEIAQGGAAVDVRTAIPVNLRPRDQPLPTELGNKFALVLLQLPAGESTVSGRLRQTQRRMNAIKNSPEALIVHVAMLLIGRSGPWLTQALVTFFAAKADAITTNVPGPREHRSLAGTRIRGILGWVPAASHQTLGTCIFTYADQVWIGIKSDAAAIPDPGRILGAFHEELEALIALGD